MPGQVKDYHCIYNLWASHGRVATPVAVTVQRCGRPGQQIATGSRIARLPLWTCAAMRMGLNVHRNCTAYEGRGEVGEGGMEVGGEGDYKYTYR